MSTMPDGQIQAAADAKTSTMHHTPVKPMERVVSPEDIERGERMERRRSAEPGFWRFFAELNAGLILTAFAIVAFKTPNHFAFGGTSGVSLECLCLFCAFGICFALRTLYSFDGFADGGHVA